MSIRKKILIYFSALSLSLIGVAFFTIYLLFAEYREEEFQKRQKEKIEITLKFLTEIREIDGKLIEAMDRITLNELHDEKLLIFDRNKQLIYSSIDDTPVRFSKVLIDRLSAGNPWLEEKDGDYDVVGVFIQNGSSAFYAISKAYDTFGYSKLNFLKYVLLITFTGIGIIIVLVSFYVAARLSYPLRDMHQKIGGYHFDKAFEPVQVTTSTLEVAALTDQFNTLMKRLKEAYAYQKNAINHISHELKTPITILVSNFERMEKEKDPEVLQTLLRHQKEDTRSLGEIINTLLEITKVESNRELYRTRLRVDEVIFDSIEEVKRADPDFGFSVEYNQMPEEQELQLQGNYPLLKMAFNNLFLNCARYSDNKTARITIAHAAGKLHVAIANEGPVIGKEERELLFQHFFRGGNSRGKRGFGLGLVFVERVVTLHGGQVTYSVPADRLNVFTVVLPLS